MNKIELAKRIEENDLTPDTLSVWKMCSPDTARSLIINLGGSTIHIPLLRTLNPFMQRMVKSLREQGCSPEQIAYDLDISPSYVRKCISGVF